MKKQLVRVTSLFLLWLTRKETLGAELMDAKGTFIRPFDPECERLDLETVGLALSRIMRFFGQTKMSVAQHSVNMARIFIAQGEEEFAKQALLHEVSEVFLGDLGSPVKATFPVYKMLEERILQKAFTCYGLDYPMAPAVKHLDSRIMVSEACVHMPKEEYWLSLNEGVSPRLLDAPGVSLEAWSSEQAFAEFIATAAALGL